jgi:uncharacterized membrane protein
MSRARRWSAALAVAGLAISLYLTATHYLAGEVPLACSSSGPVDCEQVTSSAQSMIGPVPVALLGVVWFGVLLALLVGETGSSTARLVWSVVGVLVVLYLIYAELFLIGALCLWCTAVHALVIGLLLLAVHDATAAADVASA